MKLESIFEWTMGHRIEGHPVESQLHGHRYKLRVQVQGDVSEETGFVVDFSEIKKIVNSEVIQVLDHSFMYSKNDALMTAFFSSNPTMRNIAIDGRPTGEVILKWIKHRIADSIAAQKVRLESLTLWESDSACITMS